MIQKFLKYGRALAVAGLAIVCSQNAFGSITGVSATSDASSATYRITFNEAPTAFRVFLDTDRSAGSGYSISGIGANYLIENTSLYRYSGTNGSWAWTSVRSVVITRTTTSVQWTVAKADIGSPSALNLVAQVSSPTYNSSVVSQSLTSVVSPTTTTVPQSTVTWTRCAQENGTCYFSGTRQVRYGANGMYAYKTATGLIACNNATFGDPASGVVKYCDYSSVVQSAPTTTLPPVTTTTLPQSTVTWTYCAQENGTCYFSGTRQVRYGANGMYAYRTATGSIACNNATFGDPVPGIAKSCDYSSVVQSAPVTTTTLAPTTPPPPPPTTTTLPVSSSGPTYYISPSGNDANSGSSSSPWRTIQKAASTVSAGATVILMNGTYEEPSINFTRSGTASSPITFKSQNKWMAILASTSACQPGMSVSASYITLQDIRFSISSRNANCTTYTSANVHIRAWNSREPTASNPTSGYVGFVARGLKLDYTTARSEGMKSNQDFTIIENSEAGASIELFNTKDSVIRNNLINNQLSSGISIFVKGGIRNARIYNNIIRNKVANGRAIIIGGYSCDTCHFDTATNIEAYNVVAFNNVAINESSGAMVGLYFQGAKDSAFYNNVVIGGQIGMTIGGHNTGPQAPTSNPTFKNNIVVCNGALTSGYFGWTYSGTLNADYNNFYNCSSSITQAHPIVGNPMFVNQASDWRLQAGSPAINSGIPVTMPAYGGGSLDVSRDYNGVTRSSPWDLGIYNTP